MRPGDMECAMILGGLVLIGAMLFVAGYCLGVMA